MSRPPITPFIRFLKTLDPVGRTQSETDVILGVIKEAENEYDVVVSHRDRLRKVCANLLRFIPCGKPEQGGLPQWICDIEIQARDALAECDKLEGVRQ